MNRPPMSGPAATAIAAGRGDQAVGAGPFGAAEVGGDERDDRRQDQRGADALQDRPADHQHRQVRRERGGERAAAVDHAADREGALAADDLADLAAGDHERRHHQRVEGDRRLDPGHGRADVLGDGRDRDVHHRAVEHHQELPAQSVIRIRPAAPALALRATASDLFGGDPAGVDRRDAAPRGRARSGRRSARRTRRSPCRRRRRRRGRRRSRSRSPERAWARARVQPQIRA